MQRLVIVDLAVEHDQDVAVLVRDRLVPAGQVDDAEPPHAEADPALDERAPVVRAAMADRVAHPADLGLGDVSGADRPHDAAHLRRPSLPQVTIMYPSEKGMRWSSMVQARSAG